MFFCNHLSANKLQKTSKKCVLFDQKYFCSEWCPLFGAKIRILFDKYYWVSLFFFLRRGVFPRPITGCTCIFSIRTFTSTITDRALSFFHQFFLLFWYSFLILIVSRFCLHRFPHLRLTIDDVGQLMMLDIGSPTKTSLTTSQDETNKVDATNMIVIKLDFPITCIRYLYYCTKWYHVARCKVKNSNWSNFGIRNTKTM